MVTKAAKGIRFFVISPARISRNRNCTIKCSSNPSHKIQLLGFFQCLDIKKCYDMKQPANPRSAKHPDRGDPNADYSQIHKLKDVPPYANIYVTSHGIEALRTQSEKFRDVDTRGTPTEPGYNTSKSYGNRIPGEKDARKVYGREYNRASSYNAFEEENINIEVEEFIREEHQKLNFGRWMSTNSINYD